MYKRRVVSQIVTLLVVITICAMSKAAEKSFDESTPDMTKAAESLLDCPPSYGASGNGRRLVR